MKKDRVLIADTGFTLREWKSKSENQEVCGILGCLKKPIVRCNHCKNYYCEGHRWVLGTPGH